MKSFLRCVCVGLLIFGVSMAYGQTVDDYIKKAGHLHKSGELDQAVTVMSEAVEKYPDSAVACSYLGLYYGMKAGRTNNFMEAGRIISQSFEMLDKGVSLDPDNPTTRFNRGVIAVNIPEFLGKLDTGIKDLESLVKIAAESPGKVTKDILVNGYNLLARGYQMKKDGTKATAALKKVIELSPDSEMAKRAEINIAKLSKLQKETVKKSADKKPDSVEIAALKQKIKNEPGNPVHLIKLGKVYMASKEYAAARQVLKRAIELDPKNLDAYKTMISAVGELVGKGYDDKIFEDTNYRTNLAFEFTRCIDKACELAPEDVELRLMRGISGVQMPFFVNKLDQAIADLNWILKSKTSGPARADALYWLGMAYQKKAMSYWIKVVSDYPKTEASGQVFEVLRPPVKRFALSKHPLPALSIDFILGFRDELAPQTAIWVEKKDGTFVKTIYVSGFSGYAKEQQVNLSDWADSSKFSDVDGVTGASIDLGHHIYAWDLKDISGKQVSPGEYVIKVEACYWPSMEYQLVSTAIKLDGKHKRAVTEEGNHIPYLEVTYYPAK